MDASYIEIAGAGGTKRRVKGSRVWSRAPSFFLFFLARDVIDSCAGRYMYIVWEIKKRNMRLSKKKEKKKTINGSFKKTVMVMIPEGGKKVTCESTLLGKYKKYQALLLRSSPITLTLIGQYLLQLGKPRRHRY
jgi:hypothetical protein